MQKCTFSMGVVYEYAIKIGGSDVVSLLDEATFFFLWGDSHKRTRVTLLVVVCGLVLF